MIDPYRPFLPYEDYVANVRFGWDDVVQGITWHFMVTSHTMSDIGDPSRIRRFSDFPSSYVAYVHTSDVGGHAQGGRRDLTAESYVKPSQIRPRTEISYLLESAICCHFGGNFDDQPLTISKFACKVCHNFHLESNVTYPAVQYHPPPMDLQPHCGLGGYLGEFFRESSQPRGRIPQLFLGSFPEFTLDNSPVRVVLSRVFPHHAVECSLEC